MKERTEPKRANKRQKEAGVTSKRIKSAGKIQLRMHPNLMKMDAADWSAIEELWRGI